MESPIAGFDNVGIAVTDLTRSLEFWTALGFERVSEDDGEPAALVRAGSAVLWIFETRSAASIQRRDSEFYENPPGLDHIALAVDDVDAAYRTLSDRGVRFESGPEDRWGYRVAALRDPDGTQVFLLKPIQADGQ